MNAFKQFNGLGHFANFKVIYAAYDLNCLTQHNRVSFKRQRTLYGSMQLSEILSIRGGGTCLLT